jgi:hypothetical protein
VIGKEGEGPGEFKLDPSRTLIITVYPDFIHAESRNKIVHFDRAGGFIKEVRKAPGILQALPLGDNFVVHKILYGPGGKNYFTINIYNSEMKEVKELYRQPFFTYENKVFVMPDGLNFCICDDKVFIELSPLGFVIGVFDDRGNHLDEIRHPYDKIKVTSQARERAFKDYIEIPFFKRMIRERGEDFFKNFIKQQLYEYPEYYPAIQHILADGKTIYIRTHHQNGGKEAYVVMTPEGEISKTVYLPIPKKVDFLVQMQGDKKFYTIDGGKFYYLKMVESEEDEDWEIHAAELN